MSCFRVPAVPATDSDGRNEACANCGKHASDTVKLKDCAACRLVKYCGVDCQRAHRKQHKRACKQRAAELKDEKLYSQGHERPEGDFCPLCTLPIPLPVDKHSHFKACCSKRSCIGCSMATQKRGMYDCPFCRTPMPKDDAGKLAMVQARVAKKDPEAINHLAQKHFFGVPGLLQKDGVQQDAAKAAEFYTKAAMQGHVVSRHNLGGCEGDKLNHDRAVRHFLISAKMGCKDSVETINRASMVGFATKEQYAEALKEYQDAAEEMKSPDRDEAAKLLGY
ncbi:hypothetical protein THAOC_00564 [Thalassiosira oceanica]|uniref:MYND-type domain-containing protein n=1 Tax=Thalassiosira oceanica TaxID=159749 RepID=K0TIZ4_THAOC|nr:hypothetical protein THAOC_00564 [Thalassiosira oceanica]|eukprot:EJK77595.1 hypothetical protein THAOC_00564 [Thalassiosira oceanica]